MHDRDRPNPWSGPSSWPDPAATRPGATTPSSGGYRPYDHPDSGPGSSPGSAAPTGGPTASGADDKPANAAAGSNDAGDPPGTPGPTPPASPSPAPPSAAVIRFQSCRWRKPVSGDIPAHCGHPEVFPFAGANGFNPDAWCPDCQFYKLRRTPTRRDDY